MLPLAFCNEGEDLVIKKINGKDDVTRHLENLGFVVGANVSIVSKMGDNVIVSVKESRIAISREMAQKVMV